jgi:hypothetical protein
LHLLLHFPFFVLLFDVCELTLMLQNNRPVSMHTCQLRSLLRVSVFEQKKGDRATCVTTLPALFFFSSPHTASLRAILLLMPLPPQPPPRNNALLFDVCFLQNEITSGLRRDGTQTHHRRAASTIIFLHSL